MAVLVLGTITYSQILARTAPNWSGLLVVALFVVVPTVAGLFVLLVARALVNLPPIYRRLAIPAAAVLLLLLSFQVKLTGALLGVLAVVVAASLLGGGLAGATNRGAKAGRRLGAAVSAAAGAGILVLAGQWLVAPGLEGEKFSGSSANRAAADLNLPDPSSPGAHGVLSATYGSGEDRHRPEYGEEVDLVTEPVDGSKLIDGWKGPAGWARTRYWGFGPEALPLQGRVWYPDGKGPFPLVLMVHGNHAMEDFSDGGYAYLGRLLASRGFIFASVDENFLNGTVTDVLGGLDAGLDEENDARGWLLLEHLRVWHEWNRESGHRFQGLVDTENIALIGHSRGGEAVSVAAAFNRLPYYPDDAALAFDYDFGLKAVAAIAPVDGQYEPAEIGTPLHDVNYLAIQGSHDGDMESFEGTKQYDRVAFSDGFDGFKAALYVVGANHGQFNSDWGRYDFPLPFGWLLDVGPLMEPEQQRQVAKVYLGAFLEAALHGRDEYLVPLRNHRRTGDWLPETTYLSEFKSAGDLEVATFEEDLDLTSTTLTGGRISQENLADWYEQRVDMRDGMRKSRAVYLGWRDEASKPARFTIELPEMTTGESYRALTFALADTGRTPAGTTGSDGAQGNSQRGIDLSVRVTDRGGQTAELALGHQSRLPRAVEPTLFKSDWVADPVGPEPIFQTYTIPLAEFRAENPDFDPSSIREVAFVFDRTERGRIALDDVVLEGTGEPRPNRQ